LFNGNNNFATLAAWRSYSVFYSSCSLFRSRIVKAVVWPSSGMCVCATEKRLHAHRSKLYADRRSRQSLSEHILWSWGHLNVSTVDGFCL